MNEPVNINQPDALVLIHQRNEFYKKKYHAILGVFVLSLVVAAILLGMLIYLWRHPPSPFYFAADNVGRLIQDIPKEQPLMSVEDVASWTIEALENTYSYDFINYRQQLQDAQKYFTPYGWRNYMSGLEASNNLLALTRRKLVIVAKVVGSPTLLTQGSLGGAYAWKFQMQVLVTYRYPPYNDKSKYQNPLLVTAIVQRQNVLNSYKGLGLVQLLGDLVMETPAQNLAEPE